MAKGEKPVRPHTAAAKAKPRPGTEEAKKEAEAKAEGGENAPDAEEKPDLYWTMRTRRKDKWAARREARKVKLEDEEANEPAKDDDEGGSDAEPAPSKKSLKRKRQEAERQAKIDAAAQEEAAEKAAQAEAEGKGKKKKKRKLNKAGEAAEDGAEDAAEAEEATEKPKAAKTEAAQEAPAPAGPPSTLDMEKSFRPASFFSEDKYELLNICEPLKKGLRESNFETLTEIQSKAIPHLLNGKDVLAAAKTGSGKTLSFLVPAIDLLYNVKFLPRNGLGALVISPTRELAMQIYDVLRNISKHMSQSCAVVVGGMNRKPEADKLAKGVNILVATPGRLLDHMQNTKGFVFHNLVNLTMDEADRILDIGFEEEMNAIIRMLPKKRQTALFSATQTRKVADLARLSLNKPVFVEVKSKDNVTTVAGLTQGYVVCPSENRFLLLFTFLKRNRDKKVMVFFSACNSVKFHDELLNYVDLPVQCIHGQKKQASRSSTYYNFCSADKGILLCTDVAARGLDIPKVDWIVQFDPPDEPKEYIHRVGRTARGADGQGKALLFLMPEELGFLQHLRRQGIPVSEYSFPSNKLANIQGQLERVIEKNYHLHRSSRDAYRAYLHAYAAHSHKDIFDVQSLDLQKVAKAFGFLAPPKVELNLKHTARKKPPGFKAGAKRELSSASSGHKFSADNPYGKKDGSDKRQFAR
eukprot:TRINITY_DN11231_c0_g1_i1.p1 TRINITY_DN11231_c0_g1~~TRINITY_DN11231_c0_g1_i1.p1  ORF type:complete len:695 (-),score=249.63 TRINITY_DN11231_c0_g1_i1:224-2308(-)